MDSNLLNNPAFANLSPEKLQFLLSFAQKEKTFKHERCHAVSSLKYEAGKGKPY